MALDDRSNLFYDKSALPPGEVALLFADPGNPKIGGDDTVYGLRGQDHIFGDAYRLDHGTGGNDRLFGGAGDDTLVGESDVLGPGSRGGDDYLVQGRGIGEVFGDAQFLMKGGSIGGDDILFGARLWGDALYVSDSAGGSDILDASRLTKNNIGTTIPFLEGDGTLINASAGGRDILTGSRFADRLYGEGQEISATSRGAGDVLNGLGGDDVLYGDAQQFRDRAAGGDDNLRGGAGDDTIYGDAEFVYSKHASCGDDILRGGAGNDALWGDASLIAGEAGDDMFRFAGRFGADTLGDFGKGDDRLVLESFDASDLAIDDGGPDTVLTLAGGGTITLAGYTGELAEGDNLFFA